MKVQLPRPSRSLNAEETLTPVQNDSAPKSSIPRLAPSKYRPSDVFEFEPREDISEYELALLLKALYNPAIHFRSFMDLDPELQRHFRPTKA